MAKMESFLAMFALAAMAQEAAAQPLRLGPEFQVNSYTVGEQIRPAACRSPGGEFVLVWSSLGQYGGESGFGQRYASSGARAGAEFQVNSATVFLGLAPAICCDPDGGFVVAYRGIEDFSPPSHDTGVFARRFDSLGTPLGAEFVVNDYSGAFEDKQSIACGPDGGFVVAWESFDYPTGQDGDQFGVFARRYDSAGVPVGNVFQVNTYTIGSQRRPSVCADPNGGFVVAWTSGGQDHCCTYGSFAQRFDSAGARLGSEMTVNDPAEASQDQPEAQVACGPGGEFIVAWSADLYTFSRDLLARRYNSSGSPVGTQFLVNTFTSGPQGYPDGQGAFAVGADGAGDFVVVWNTESAYGDVDGSYGAVAAQKFASSGVRLGTEFQVNTFTLGHQGGEMSGVALAVGADGDFVVAWGSKGYGFYQDGDEYGIFGQRYLGSSVIPPDGASGTVGAGGTVTTDPENYGVSPGDPVATSVTSPVAGTIVIVESTVSTPPAGFTALEVSIDAPAATVGDPLVLRFSLDASILPTGAGPAEVDVFRDGQPVPDCSGAPSAIPDPCVSLRESIPGGVRLTVLTSNITSLGARAALPRGTTTTWTFAVSPCAASPRDPCRGAQKSILIVKDAGDDGKDKLIWKWLKGGATTLEEIEDPTATATYAFCVYAGSPAGLIADAVVPSDNTKWTPSGTTGFKYKDKGGTSDGITTIKLKSGGADAAKALVKGKGGNLPDPTLGDLPLPITAQLVNLETGLCLQGVFDTGDVIENAADQLKAKAQ